MISFFIKLVKYVQKSWAAIGTTFLLLAVIEFSVMGVSHFIKAFSNPPKVYSLLDKDAPIPESYEANCWYLDYVDEFKLAYHLDWKPYVYWRTRPFKGTFINVDKNCLRKTWNVDSQDEAFRIFMFGGSTVWGWGARDDYTIPSLLSKILYERYQIKVKVVNFGEVGYVSTQEVITLLNQLQNQNYPDLVIFFDGLNDVCSTLRTGQSGIAGVPWDELERKKAFHVEQFSLFKKLLSFYATHSPLYSGIHHLTHLFNQKRNAFPNFDHVAAEIMKVYLGNMKSVKALSKSFHFGTLFYWQPTILTKSKLTSYEKELESAGESLLKARSLFKRVNAMISLEIEPFIHDITDILSEEGQSYYIDYFHTNEKGNEKIARKIADDIFRKYKPKLKSTDPL